MNKLFVPFAMIISALFFIACDHGASNKTKIQDGITPVVKWTAKPPDTSKTGLGFDLLQNTHTTTLYYVNPETGTCSHHPNITYFKKTIFTSWSNQWSNEDAAGQRVLMRRSTDKGETWEDIVELFPPLARFDPASEKEDKSLWMEKNEL